MNKPQRPDYRPPTPLSLGPLFEQAAYQKHSETSKAAATGISRSGKNKEHQRKTLAYLKACGERGATDVEIDAHFRDIGEQFVTMRPRRIHLRDEFLVVDSGRQRNGSTVWVATSQAQEKTAA